MEAVKFGADKSIPGFIGGPKGAPGVIVIQECVARAACSSAADARADCARRAFAPPLALTTPRRATALRVLAGGGA